MTIESLKSAIDHLGAVPVAPDRYAYRADKTRRYYVTDESDLRLLGSLLADHDTQEGLAYSEWCSATTATEMPAWWTPERRYEVRDNGHFIHVATLALARRYCAEYGRGRIFTADLTTGEEIPA
jgi:hypothetical protein